MALRQYIPAASGILILLFFVSGCKQKDKQSANKSENNIDAARNFIRAALDGKFDKARNYMIEDSLNVNYMDVAERSYQRADQSTKTGYRSASINIIDVKDAVKDSITYVVYSNSFKNDPDTLKVVKIKGQWLIDLKFLYLHDADSISTPEIINDKIK